VEGNKRITRLKKVKLLIKWNYCKMALLHLRTQSKYWKMALLKQRAVLMPMAVLENANIEMKQKVW
jgi:hypothetical protein